MYPAAAHDARGGLIYMVWKITPELQTAIDHVSEQKVAQKAGEFLEQAIKHSLAPSSPRMVKIYALSRW